MGQKGFFSKIGFINLYTPDKERLIRFYRDVLEMQPLDEMHESSNWYGFQTGETTFAVEPLSNRDHLKEKGITVPGNVLMQFVLDSDDELERANRHIESKGLRLVTRSEKTAYGTFSNFLDPDGNMIEMLVAPQ